MSSWFFLGPCSRLPVFCSGPCSGQAPQAQLQVNLLKKNMVKTQLLQLSVCTAAVFASDFFAQIFFLLIIFFLLTIFFLLQIFLLNIFWLQIFFLKVHPGPCSRLSSHLLPVRPSSPPPMGLLVQLPGGPR